MQFAKMHGCGNDYILVNEKDIRGYDYEELSRKMSDRKNGIGSDGLIIAGESDCADIRMYMYNSDGSRGKMCGNGIRLLAKYAFERKLSIKRVMRIETDSGIKTVWLHFCGEKVESVKVDMGKPELKTDKIPVRTDEKRIIDKKVRIEGREYLITCVSMGNPHTVIFAEDVDKISLCEEGKNIENDSMFPDRTNVMFVQVLNDEQLKMRVWERGSGITLACGTGACAALFAGYVTGRCKNEADIIMPGGIVHVNYDTVDDIVYLYGDAHEVFTGEYKETEV